MNKTKHLKMINYSHELIYHNCASYVFDSLEHFTIHLSESKNNKLEIKKWFVYMWDYLYLCDKHSSDSFHDLFNKKLKYYNEANINIRYNNYLKCFETNHKIKEENSKKNPFYHDDKKNPVYSKR